MSNTFTRVGTANMYDNALRNLGERHSSLVGLQDNLTAGKRVVRPSGSVGQNHPQQASRKLPRLPLPLLPRQRRHRPRPMMNMTRRMP